MNHYDRRDDLDELVTHSRGSKLYETIIHILN